MFIDKNISSILGSCGLKYTMEFRRKPPSGLELLMFFGILLAVCICVGIVAFCVMFCCVKIFGPCKSSGYNSARNRNSNNYYYSSPGTTSFSSGSYTGSGFGGTSFR